MAKLKKAVHERTGQETKEKIIDTAINLFSREGYPGTSIRDITNTVGIKESSLYHHFASKQDIIDQIYVIFKAILSSENPIKNTLSQAIKPLDSYLMLQNNLIAFKKLFDKPVLYKIYRIIAMERYRDKQAFEIMTYDIYQNMTKFHEELFNRMIAGGIIKPLLNPRLLAQEYVYTVLGMFGDYNIAKYYDQSTTTIEDLMYEYVKFFWDRVKNI
jgi:AcrR family transcriptional regulator